MKNKALWFLYLLVFSMLISVHLTEVRLLKAIEENTSAIQEVDEKALMFIRNSEFNDSLLLDFIEKVNAKN